MELYLYSASPLCLRDMDRDKFIFCFPLLQVDSVKWLNCNGQRRCLLGGRTLLLRISGAFAVQKVVNTCPLGP